ncbi:MAG: hypothetical protein AB7O47_10260 [Flavobacteriales bacterium]
MKYLKALAILSVFCVTFYSCTKEDDNKNVTGTTSPSDPRNVFIGTWVSNEDSQVFGTTTYSVDILAHSSITNRIIVSNFYNLGFQASNCQMEISGNSITIFQQNLSGYDVIGSGTLVNSSTINLSYTTNDGAGIDSVSTVYTKTN